MSLLLRQYQVRSIDSLLLHAVLVAMAQIFASNDNLQWLVRSSSYVRTSTSLANNLTDKELARELVSSVV